MADSIAAPVTGVTGPRKYTALVRTLSGVPAVAIATQDILYNGVWHEAVLKEPAAPSDSARARFGFQGGGTFTLNIASSDAAQLATLRSALRDREFELTLLTTAENPARQISNVRRALARKITRTATALQLECQDFALQTVEGPYPNLRLTKESWPTIFVDHQDRVVPDGAGIVIKCPLSSLGLVATKYRNIGLQKRAGYTYTIQAVYRNGALVNPSEYTQITAASTGSPSYTCDGVDFNREQRDTSGREYTLTYDVLVQNAGNTAHHAHVELAYLLGLWGIGTGATLLSGATATEVVNGEMFADCTYAREWTRADIVKYLLMILRGDLVAQNNGTWDLVQDIAGTATGDWREAVGDEIEIRESVDPERKQKITLRYRPRDARTNELTATRERTIGGSAGVEEEINPLVRRHATADRLCDYLGKTCANLEEHDLAIHGVQTRYGERINVSGSTLPATTPIIIRDIGRPADRNALKAVTYKAANYTYSAQSLPSDSSDYAIDYSQTAPAAPTPASLISTTTNLNSAGVVEAQAVVRATMPAVNAVRLWCVTINNVTNTQTAPQALVLNAGNFEAVIGGLAPSTAYTVQIYAENAAGVTGAVATVPVSSAGYFVAPGALPTPQAIGSTGKSVLWVTQAPTGTLVQFIQWQGKAGASSTWVDIDARGNWIQETDTLVYGQVRNARCRLLDQFGNASAWSAAGSYTPVANVNTQDYVANSVGTTALANLSVSAAKISGGAVYQGAIQAGAVDNPALSASAVTNPKVAPATLKNGRLDIALSSGTVNLNPGDFFEWSHAAAGVMGFETMLTCNSGPSESLYLKPGLLTTGSTMRVKHEGAGGSGVAQITYTLSRVQA